MERRKTKKALLLLLFLHLFPLHLWSSTVLAAASEDEEAVPLQRKGGGGFAQQRVKGIEETFLSNADDSYEREQQREKDDEEKKFESGNIKRQDFRVNLIARRVHFELAQIIVFNLTKVSAKHDRPFG